ncbi:cyclase family protein [Actinoplanes sp. KI2]|uniref:cyclase family protein n=1 Tax=Actinoplanes sp. KI2 TaxID=2983315 RepID=UPI0021D60DCB|nr:cyclase family protein [Actinoplanes sp. KI2]MCU7731052.1 cyclase family protein [Actinoplanes sp. KI2]
MLQYRAELDAAVTLAGGGSLRVQGLRIDVPHPDVTRAEIGALLVAKLGLRDAERVELDQVRIFGERAEPTGAAAIRAEFVELSHVISAGMTTYPGLPGPAISPHLTWADSRTRYAEGTEFSMDRIDMIGQTGTYLDSPRHRYEDGADLAGLPLGRLADLPAVVVRMIGSGRRAVEAGDLESLTLAGHAVLLHTGGDRHWGTAAYADDHPYLSADAARLLVERGVALVGIDAINIDDTSAAAGGQRPAHSILLAAGIPIVEHLTGLAEVPPTGARFTAAPPRISGFGTFPVRAFATMPWYEPHDHTRSAGWLPTGSGDD